MAQLACGIVTASPVPIERLFGTPLAGMLALVPQSRVGILERRGGYIFRLYRNAGLLQRFAEVLTIALSADGSVGESFMT